MAFRDLGDDYPPVEPIVLPIRGKEYAFPGEISARSWLLVQRLGEQGQRAARAKARGEVVDLTAEALSDTSYSDLAAEMFGDVDMSDLSSGEAQRVFFTLMAYHMSDNLERAEAVWNARGEAPAPSRETRRSQAKSRP